MRALMPAPELTSFRREMDRLFDRFWEDDGENLPALREWVPSLDFSETVDAYMVRIEIPGLEPKDVQVTLQDNVLTVKGEKKEEIKQQDERFFRLERSHGMFSRSLRLPAPVDGAKVNAVFKSGLLTVTVPKTPEAKPATIPIKVG
jgi:HSP20 family protein